MMKPETPAEAWERPPPVSLAAPLRAPRLSRHPHSRTPLPLDSPGLHRGSICRVLFPSPPGSPISSAACIVISLIPRPSSHPPSSPPPRAFSCQNHRRERQVAGDSDRGGAAAHRPDPPPEVPATRPRAPAGPLRLPARQTPSQQPGLTRAFALRPPPRQPAQQPESDVPGQSYCA
jgi:hypothetical protein